MTVFKGFMTLVKRNIFLFFLYMAIFMTICILIQVLTGGEGVSSFQEESLDIAVIDRDGGALAKGLTDYLGQKHHLVEIEDDKNTIQENLFYRNIYYVVTIPEDFEEKCLANGEKLNTTKIPGTVSAFYVDQQIETFMNAVRVLRETGFSMEDALEEVERIGAVETEVTLLDRNGYGGKKAPYASLFQYLPFMVVSVLCYIIGFIMIAYRKKDVRRRILCSAVSQRMQNIQLVAGYLVLGIVFWIACLVLTIALYGNDFLSDVNLVYYLLNSFVLVLVTLAISFLIGVLVRREEVINGVVNVVSLGMCFLCGVFVSLDVLSKGVKAAAHFLPVYWYETVNEVLGGSAALSESQSLTVWKGLGIQMLFAAAILCVGLAVSKCSEQEK